MERNINKQITGRMEFVSWEEYESLLTKLQESIDESPIDYRHVIVPMQGAEKIANDLLNRCHRLRCAEPRLIYYSSRRGDINGTKTYLMELNQVPGRKLAVDDICDSGKTFKYIKSAIPTVNFGALFFKPKSNIVVKHRAVDMSYAQSMRWIVFPWEG